jgi:hypothetical protein
MMTGHPPVGGDADGAHTFTYRQSSEYYSFSQIWGSSTVGRWVSLRGTGDGGWRQISLKAVASYGLSRDLK